MDELDELISLTKDTAKHEADLEWLRAGNTETTNAMKHESSHIWYTQNKILKIKTILKLFLEENQYKSIENDLLSIGISERNRLEEEKELKFRPLHTYIDHTAIRNLSDVIIPPDVAMVLSWGRRFAFPHNIDDKNRPQYLAELECTIDNTVPFLTKDHVTAKTRAEIDKNSKYQYDDNIHWLNYLNYRTKRFFELHKNIRAIDSDKGATTVIIEIEKYNELVLNFLDNKTFSLICEDSPLQKLIKIETHFILALKNNPKTKDLAINYQPNTLNLA